MSEGAASPSRLRKALGYSLHGLASAWRTEGSFRFEVAAAVVLVPVASLVSVTIVERVLLIGSVLLVMVVELLNSSIEAAVDRISIEQHPLSKKAKDTGSAAVLVASLCGGLVWAAILGPRVAAWFEPYFANL